MFKKLNIYTYIYKFIKKTQSMVRKTVRKWKASIEFLNKILRFYMSVCMYVLCIHLKVEMPDDITHALF